MGFHDDEYGFAAGYPPSLVSLTSFASIISPSPRRLSSCFTQPAEPVRSQRRLAWVSLQGRLVGADDASSVKSVDPNGKFTTEEAAAWELFTPAERVLTVAVVGAAAANSKKNEKILKLQNSVELRDQVLSSMQKKLDNLCELLNYVKDQPEVQSKSVERGCKLCHYNLPQNGSLFNTSTKESNEDEVFKYKIPMSNETEPDERRMSDLSDWAPSVASSVDVQLDSLALEHDFDCLRRECDQKDATIKELSTFVRSSEVLGSKRIVELEDIIRRKNMIINKLRKDMIILEQKVVNLTRRRRPSFTAASSHPQQHLPTMTDNVVYDMDSTTDPSSSDSDYIPRNRAQAPLVEVQETSVEMSEEVSKLFMQQNLSRRATSPLKEKSFNQTPKSVAASKSKPKVATNGSGENRSRRRPPIKSKEVAAPKRWM